MKLLIKMAIIGFVSYQAFSLSPTYALAPTEIVVLEAKNPTYQEVLWQFAKQYGSSYVQMEKVISCESGWKTTAVGDGGKAYGLGQFHQPTFLMWEKEIGLDLEYKSPEDQLQLMSYAFSKGYQRHWTCWTKLFK